MEDITIPKGYEAKIEGDKVVFVKKESEDERIRKDILSFLKNGSPYCCIGSIRRQKWAAYFEKQKEQKLIMIQWKGDNLKEVIDFTGKSPRFEEWFKSWEDFENYVHSHGDILKLFCEDGSHYEVPVGSWIVKTPDGYNIPSRFRFIQKPAEWSEKDRHAIESCEYAIKETFKDEQNPHRVGTLDWLNSLPERFNLPPKQEWSEEDKKMIKELIKNQEILIDTASNEQLRDIYSKEISWLKSVCPQSHWKPSKEQLTALERLYRACYRDDICSLDDGYQLRELYNKLTEIQ